MSTGEVFSSTGSYHIIHTASFDADVSSSIIASFYTKGGRAGITQEVKLFYSDMENPDIETEGHWTQFFPSDDGGSIFGGRSFSNKSTSWRKKKFYSQLPDTSKHIRLYISGSVGVGVETPDGWSTPRTYLVYDNFVIQRDNPKVEVSPEGILIYQDEDHYLKMTPESELEVRTSILSADRAYFDDLEVYGDVTFFGGVAASPISPYNSDPSGISSGDFKSAGTVTSYARGDHVHELPFSTIDSVIQLGELTKISGSSSSTGSFGSIELTDGMSIGGNASVAGDLMVNSISSSGDIIPTSDDHGYLGSSEKAWKDIYAKQTTTGGMFESGLRTKSIGENPTGTVVVWRDGKLVPCDRENDVMVQGVVKRGKDEPIVVGAEPVLITGKIDAGDFVVTSNKIGHGKSIKPKYLYMRSLFGKVIGQALESGDGDSHTIKTMIRKM